MINVLLAGQENLSYFDLNEKLNTFPDLKITIADTGKMAISISSWKEFDIAIVCEQLKDMTGLDFVRQLILSNPLINVALVSPEHKDTFHGKTEGLGILGQLHPQPTVKEIEQLMLNLSGILNQQMSI